MNKYLFIRDDDACSLNKRFRFYFDAAIERKIPVVYAVIPGKLEKDFVRFLKRAKDRHPQLLDIVQHGWKHRNYSKGVGKKYEFGVGRSLKFQRKDVRQGQKLMTELFGDLFTSAFVPPYHGYDERTLRVVCEENFHVFSADASQRKCKGILNLSVDVSFTHYAQDRSHVINPASMVLESVIRKFIRKSIVGLVTHHADFTTPASRKELTQFLDYLVALRSIREWRVVLFSDVLSELGA